MKKVSLPPTYSTKMWDEIYFYRNRNKTISFLSKNIDLFSIIRNKHERGIITF